VTDPNRKQATYLGELSQTPEMTEACVRIRRLRPKISANIRARVFRVKGMKCVECGTSGFHTSLDGTTTFELTLDHILPWAKGGCSHFHNLQPMCKDCNNRKSDKVEKELHDHQ
jgi:5-methylcytosine-specific restriction endonuclease McrA